MNKTNDMSVGRASGAMNVILWIVQVFLSVSFIWSAAMKFFQSGKLNEMWAWTIDNPGLMKVTGVFDLLAGLGLVLPALLRIQPRLTILAAYGTVVLMIAASAFHVSRGEASQIGVNIFFAISAVFIAWGRQKKAPIMPK